MSDLQQHGLKPAARHHGSAASLRGRLSPSYGDGGERVVPGDHHAAQARHGKGLQGGRRLRLEGVLEDEEAAE